MEILFRMKRTSSYVAQFAFDTANRLHVLSKRSNPFIRISAKAAGKIFRPFGRSVSRGHLVDANCYGHPLRMPAEHPLALVLANNPQFNRPLALSVTALAASTATRPITVVDIGANVGETIAVIEQRNPAICSYLCIEADAEIASLCRFNHQANPAVQTEQAFIGENEGAVVRLEDDGRANSSTKLVSEASAVSTSETNRLRRLDTVAGPFAETHGGLSLIKVDTEGYDFSVLRSGSALIDRYRPALYFEWYPALLEGLNENPCDGFDFLARLGYEHFVFFSSVGDYYCKLPKPDRFLLSSLAKAASQNPALLYFDVLACTSESLCNQVVELSVTPDAQRST
jgi:FkbM family methyltransferase